MSTECVTCGLAPCDLPDGVDPDDIFERVDGACYCMACSPEESDQ
jgi:hypothetical protein